MSVCLCAFFFLFFSHTAYFFALRQLGDFFVFTSWIPNKTSTMASKPLVEDIVAAAVSAGIQTSPEGVAFALGFATAMNAPALDTAPFKIYYHDGFSGRAQTLFLLFADAGLEYERKSKGDVTDVRCVHSTADFSCHPTPLPFARRRRVFVFFIIEMLLTWVL